MPESSSSFGSISKGIKDILDGSAGVIDSVAGLKHGTTRVGSTDINYDWGSDNSQQPKNNTMYIIIGLVAVVGLIFLIK